jgi:hypothetical protein
MPLALGIRFGNLDAFFSLLSQIEGMAKIFFKNLDEEKLMWLVYLKSLHLFFLEKMKNKCLDQVTCHAVVYPLFTIILTINSKIENT